MKGRSGARRLVVLHPSPRLRWHAIAGTMRYLLLTKTFSPDQYTDGLESWAWIGLEGKEPVLASLFGHVFLKGADGYWYLDVIGGSLSLLWPDASTLQAVLDTEDGQDEFLLGGLAFAADRRGLVLAENEVFDFAPPPVLGGPFDVANLSATDFVVAVNIAGQIHEQVRKLSPGTKIGRVTVDAEAEPRAKKFWRRNR